MEEMPSYKRLPFIIWIVLAVLLIVCIAALNYTVDPGKLFSSPAATELKAVEYIESGKNVENLDNYNERLVKRTLCLDLDRTSVLALGSSRAALITSEMSGTESFFNLSVAGAMLEEVIGLYDLYYTRNGAPERIIITVDPWYFCSDYDSKRFKGSLGDGYFDYCTNRLGYDLSENDYEIEMFYEDPMDFSFWKLDLKTKLQLFSVTYFQSSFKTLMTGGGSNISVTDDAFGIYGILRKDGSYAYPEAYRSADYSTIISRSSTSSIIGEGTYDTGSGKRASLFSDFIQSLLEDGVNVDFVLIPMNPEIYVRSLESGIPLEQVEQYVYAFADKNKIDCVGSYSSDKLRTGAEDFYDAYHYRPERVSVLIAALEGMDD